MKIIVTHATPDLDAISSVWAIKRFLPGWEDAEVKFVPAGLKINSPKKAFQQAAISATPTYKEDKNQEVVEDIGEDEVLHVDTGLGPLDHHQTADSTVCGASLSWQYALDNNPQYKNPESDRMVVKREAIERIIAFAVEIDHFRELFWEDSQADRYEMTIVGIIDGLKMQKPDDDKYVVQFVMECLDALLLNMENRVWAEREIKEKGIEFQTQWGKGLGVETLNDDIIKLAQKMGYIVVVRKDPRKGNVRIKAKPQDTKHPGKYPNVDLTPVYDTLVKKDPKATWFLHVSKKMLLNGSAKNPNSIPSKLTLREVIQILKDC